MEGQNTDFQQKVNYARNITQSDAPSQGGWGEKPVENQWGTPKNSNNNSSGWRDNAPKKDESGWGTPKKYDQGWGAPKKDDSVQGAPKKDDSGWGEPKKDDSGLGAPKKYNDAQGAPKKDDGGQGPRKQDEHPIIFETKSENLFQLDKKKVNINSYRNERGEVRDTLQNLFPDNSSQYQIFNDDIKTNNNQQTQSLFSKNNTLFKSNKQNQIFNNPQINSQNNNQQSLFIQQNPNLLQLNQSISQNQIFNNPQINIQNNSQQSLFGQQNPNQLFQNNLNSSNSNIFQQPVTPAINNNGQVGPIYNSQQIYNTPNAQNSNSNIFQQQITPVINNGSKQNFITPNYGNYQNQNSNQNFSIFNNNQPQQSVQLNLNNPLNLIPQNLNNIFQKSNQLIDIKQNNIFKSNESKQPIKQQFDEKFNILTNHQQYEPFKKITELDSSVFQEEFSIISMQKKQELEQTYLRLPVVNQEYTELYQSTYKNDIRIKFITQQLLQSHKIVLISQSPYFKKLFDLHPAEDNIQLKIDFDSTKLAFKYMYYSNLSPDELSLDMEQAINLMGVSIYLQLTPLLTLIIIKNIIPKLNNNNCLQLLSICHEKFFNEQIEQDSVPIIKLLFKYCVNYFSNNSQEILKQESQQQYFEHLDNDTINVLVDKSLFKYKDFDHMHKLLEIVQNKLLCNNIIELMQKQTRPFRNFMSFDKKYIPNIEEINRLKPEHVYDTIMFNPPPDLRQTPNVSKSKDFFIDNTMLDEDMDDLIYFNDITLRNVKNPQSKQKVQVIFSLQVPDYIMELDLKPDYKNRMIISQKFYSTTRSFSLILEVNLEQNISLYIQERGPKKLDQITKSCNFSSCFIKFSLYEENDNYDQFLFYSFANDQKIAVGLKNAFNLKVLKDQKRINLRVYVNEYSIHSCALHYINSQFQSLLQLHMDGELEERGDEFASMTPQLLFQQRNNRKSSLLLERFLANDCQKIVVDLNQESKGNNLKKSFLPDTQGHYKLNSESKLQSAEKNPRQKLKMGFYDISTFDLYYLLTSDNLNIDNEKYVLFYIYRHCLEKTEKEIRLILSGLRFTYLDIVQILDVGRDHDLIRENSFFRRRISIEIGCRQMNRKTCIDKPRKFYKMGINQNNQNFKFELLDWLLSSNHHIGFQNELRKILSENQQQINVVQNMQKNEFIKKKCTTNFLKQLGMNNVNNRSYIPPPLMSHMNYRNDSTFDHYSCSIF